MPLSDPKVRNLKPADKPFTISDGRGLCIIVFPNGSKLGRMAYRFDGRQKPPAFDQHPAVTRAMVRKRRKTAGSLRAQLRNLMGRTRPHRAMAGGADRGNAASGRLASQIGLR